MAKRKPALSTVVAFMSEEAQDQVREQAGLVSSLPLTSILPDPAQPRQLLSDASIQKTVAGEQTPAAALQGWINQAKGKNVAPAHKRNVQQLRRLADSIAKHGLINPVSVRRIPSRMLVPEDAKYLIITGERRYWAHILLQLEEREIQEGVETQTPDRIKVTVAPEGISVRAHQIIENLLREDIDAVEKATGFVALRQELTERNLAISGDEVNHGSPSKPVKWKLIEETLGISSRYRIYVTSVLNLSEEAQAIIHTNGLTERTVRPISQKLKKRPDLQVRALQQVVARQQESADSEGPNKSPSFTVDDVVDSLLLREERKQQRTASESAIQTIGPEQLHARIKTTLRLFERLGESEMLGLAEALANSEINMPVMADLQALKQQLNQLLNAVEGQVSAKQVDES